MERSFYVLIVLWIHPQQMSLTDSMFLEITDYLAPEYNSKNDH